MSKLSQPKPSENKELDEIFKSCWSYEFDVPNSREFDEVTAKEKITQYCQRQVIEGRESELLELLDEFRNNKPDAVDMLIRTKDRLAQLKSALRKGDIK